MTKNLKALTILLIVTTFSGCSLFNNALVEPLCLPERPVLEDLSINEQSRIPSEILGKVGGNDLALKGHLVTIERIVETHNEQFKAQCL